MSEYWYEFDPEKHEHFINGVKRPGITSILDQVGFISEFAKNYHRSEQGKIGHELCRICFTGQLDDYEIPTVNERWIDTILRFMKEYDIQPFEHSVFGKICEVPFGSQKKLFGGIPDLLDSKLRIWENKFWSSSNRHSIEVAGIQTAAQEILLSENLGIRKFRQRAVVHFEETRYTVHKLADPADWAVFVSALNCVSWKEQHK